MVFQIPSTLKYHQDFVAQYSGSEVRFISKKLLYSYTQKGISIAMSYPEDPSKYKWTSTMEDVVKSDFHTFSNGVPNSAYYPLHTLCCRGSSNGFSVAIQRSAWSSLNFICRVGKSTCLFCGLHNTRLVLTTGKER